LDSLFFGKIKSRACLNIVFLTEKDRFFI